LLITRLSEEDERGKRKPPDFVLYRRADGPLEKGFQRRERVGKRELDHQWVDWQGKRKEEKLQPIPVPLLTRIIKVRGKKLNCEQDEEKKKRRVPLIWKVRATLESGRRRDVHQKKKKKERGNEKSGIPD